MNAPLAKVAQASTWELMDPERKAFKPLSGAELAQLMGFGARDVITASPPCALFHPSTKLPRGAQ